MSNVPPGGQSGPFPGGQGGPYFGGPGPAPLGDPYESGPYRPVTREPLIYFHVMLNGTHVGYLWAGTDDRSAGFLRRPGMLDVAYETPGFWSQRLMEASWEKLPSREAVRRWIGRPEDPVGGGIPADATEHTAANYVELRRIDNPDYQPSPTASLMYGELPDGTPLDRSKGWGPLSLQVPASYGLTTAGPVRHLPVVRDDGLVLGYLWAAVHDNAARYLPRDDAAAIGSLAANAWVPRLRELHAQGVPALEALERCRSFPPDPTAGHVRPDARTQQSESLDELQRHASVYGQSLRLAENPVPSDPEVTGRPALDPQERDAVLNYLNQGLLVYDSGNFVPDDFDPSHPQHVPDSYRTDGTWVWRGGIPYHLEHHGVPPEPALLQHIRGTGFRLLQLGPDERERGKQTLRLHRLLVPPPSFR
ncbi:hypothetical protein [Actinomadura sediminis]|uniref:Uncharacterized protein n=1 Tax=Actinomadura sediminis TaxID=1038904 RepID=A0ABW3EQ94_9ACTN